MAALLDIEGSFEAHYHLCPSETQEARSIFYKFSQLVNEVNKQKQARDMENNKGTSGPKHRMAG